MDDQHRKIFRSLEELEASVVSGKSLDRAAELIEAIRNDSEIHFAAEEKFLAIVEFPGLVQQRVQHQQFMKRLGQAKIHTEITKSGIPMAEVHNLQSWILGHVVGLDREYADYLKGMH